MAEYTIEAIAVKCNRSARQVTRWLQSGKLEARRVGQSNKWEVSDEALVPFLPPEATDTILSRLEALESRLDAQGRRISLERLEAAERLLTQLSDRVAELERLVQATPAPVKAMRPTRKSDTPAAPRPPAGPVALHDMVGSEHAAPADIPAGSVQFFEFADRHHVNRKTFKDQLLRGAVHFIKRPKAGRPDEVERWLTPADQGEAVRFWQSNGTVYHPCLECPHQT